MNDIYSTLNPPQQEAVYHTDGPLLILAGAGSGKTRVLTHRIAYLIDEKGVNPWNILAITFTNKAASEMRERVDKIVGFGSESIWVSTFHSTCVRILRRHIDRLGYPLILGGLAINAVSVAVHFNSRRTTGRNTPVIAITGAIIRPAEV